MSFLRALLLVILMGSTTGAAAAPTFFPSEEGPLTADEAFRLLPARRSEQTVRVEWAIAPGHYLYRDQLRIEVITPAGFRLAPPRLPSGDLLQDPQFGRVAIYRTSTSAEFDLPPGLKGPLQLRVRFQGCSDSGLCYPPQLQPLPVPAAK